MERTNMECINKTLDELGDEEFKKFQRFLRDPANLEGRSAVGKARLEKKDRMETADMILQTYPDDVDQIMANVLGKLEMIGLQKHYQNKVQSQGAAVAVPAQSKEAAAAQSKEAAASDPKIAFLKKHQTALIQRVSMVSPILDLLYNAGALKSEAYSELTSERTAQDKMRKLFLILEKSGKKAKHLFYEGLVENEAFLLEDLNEC